MLFDAKGNKIEFRKFPNGEVQIPQSFNNACYSTITLKWESDEDIFHLMLIARYWKIATLNILYMPYSRMDRDENGGSCCALRYVGEFIKSLNIPHIRVVDPHSELTLAYLGEGTEAVYPFSSFEDPIFNNLGNFDDAVIMFPDAGAQKRYAKLPMYKNHASILGFKVRDFKTGEITKYGIASAIPLANRRIVIVDDLCSYGGTFLAAAEALRAHNPADITLVVSHCENAAWQGKLFAHLPCYIPAGSNIPVYVDNIVTTDSIFTTQNRLIDGNIHVMDLRRKFRW